MDSSAESPPRTQRRKSMMSSERDFVFSNNHFASSNGGSSLEMANLHGVEEIREMTEVLHAKLHPQFNSVIEAFRTKVHQAADPIFPRESVVSSLKVSAGILYHTSSVVTIEVFDVPQTHELIKIVFMGGAAALFVVIWDILHPNESSSIVHEMMQELRSSLPANLASVDGFVEQCVEYLRLRDGSTQNYPSLSPPHQSTSRVSQLVNPFTQSPKQVRVINRPSVSSRGSATPAAPEPVSASTQYPAIVNELARSLINVMQTVNMRTGENTGECNRLAKIFVEEMEKQLSLIVERRVRGEFTQGV